MHNKSILIIEDDKLLRELISDNIELLNSKKTIFKNIIQASDGVDGIRKARNQTFDIVLVDINLPKINGISVIEDLIKDGIYEPSQFIVISGGFDKEYVEKIKKIGIRNALPKPFNSKKFFEIVLKSIK